MTAGLLEAVGRTGLSAAVMILAAAILRLRFQDRTPRRAFCLLWDLVLVRLLVLVDVPSPVSIRRWLPAAPPPVQEVSGPPAVLVEGTRIVREAYVSSVVEETARTAPDWSMVLTALWLAGALLLAAWFLWSHLRSRRIYAASLPVREVNVKKKMDIWNICISIKIKVFHKC